MKVLITGDLHLGFGGKSEREKDSYLALERVLGVAKEEDCKFVILAGDIFDARIPKPEAWAAILNFLKELKNEGRECIAIYGNHERRGGNLINPLQSLAKADLIKLLHCSYYVPKGYNLAFFGMSYVPDKYASDVLREWNPKPLEGYYNILILHQNIFPFMYSELEEVSLKLEDLPKGFDLIVNGHIHYRVEKRFDSFTFIIPGSLIPVQLNKKEAEIRKGCYVLDLDKAELKFREVEVRRFFYEEVESLAELEGKLRRILEISEKEGEKPLVKIVVKGIRSFDLNLIEQRYRERAILHFKKEFEKRVEKTHEEICQKRVSIEERIKEILNRNISLKKIDVFEFMDALSQENFELVEGLLKKEYDNQG
ncbi:MAG: hypothetical protein DRO65_04310 [Candidatus Altiarchaeales archaeon]|nr:MAG: hypothetical protein DRO65_04310 [Candidatus Altiarchaeales archaeon]